MDYDLSVTGRSKVVTKLNEIISQFLVVVDLAVQNYDNVSLFIEDWLVSAAKVDDGESSMTEYCATLARPQSFTVWATVLE